MVKGIDGISYLPLLTGNGEVSRSHEYIYYEFYEQGGKQSILKDGWKLVRLNMSKSEKLKEELYYLPDELLDYVVVHELSHRRHMDHSSAFWAEVGTYCPDYRTLRKNLKQYSLT